MAELERLELLEEKLALGQYDLEYDYAYYHQATTIVSREAGLAGTLEPLERELERNQG